MAENRARRPQRFLGGVVENEGHFVILIGIERILQPADAFAIHSFETPKGH